MSKTFRFCQLTYLFLVVGVISHPTPASAETICEKLMIPVRATEKALDTVWNARRNWWAKLTVPKEIKNFQKEKDAFVAARAYYDRLLPDHEIVKARLYDDHTIENIETIEIPSNFTEKLAFLEVLMSKNQVNRSSPVDLLENGTAFDQKRVFSAINAVIPKRRITRIKTKYKIERLQEALLQDQYTEVFGPITDDQISNTLKEVSELRLAQENVSLVLYQMGQIKDNSEFRRFFEDLFKTEAYGIGNALTIEANVEVLKHGVQMTTGVPLVLLPEVNGLRWIDIPLKYELMAVKNNLQYAWDNGLEEYLMTNQKNKAARNRVYRNEVYQRIRLAWNRTVVASLIIFSTVTATRSTIDLVQKYEMGQKVKKISAQSKPMTPAELEKVPKTFSPAIQQKLWDKWKNENPEYADKPESEPYQAAHDVFFKSDSP